MSQGETDLTIGADPGTIGLSDLDNLNGAQLDAVVDAITDSFDENQLGRLLLVRLGKKLANLAGPGKWSDRVFSVVDESQKQGFGRRLVDAIELERPDAERIKSLRTRLSHLHKGPAITEAVSNVPIRVPMHFMGRDDALSAIDAALHQHKGRLAIAALHGLRGVGKTTLAAAYAERYRGDYRATWWIRAQTEAGMRSDLTALGVRLNWVAADEKEEPAVAAVMERLRHEGEGILLIFDNAPDASALKPYLPRGGRAQVLVTSNAHTWRGIATPVEIQLWPTEIGAEYLIARTGRANESESAVALSESFGGLPLAHEQAAAYCERLDISFATYRERFEAAPARLLDDQRHAPAEYGPTVAKTFALAIEEARKLHHAAEPLIVHAALLAPEPIPLFLFSEAREQFGEPLATALADDGLDEVAAALRAFALVDRETITDERDPAITTDCIRLHRLVRQVAAERYEGNAHESARRALVWAMAAVYPQEVFNNPNVWPRARRLDRLALALVGGGAALPNGVEVQVSSLMSRLACYRHSALGALAQARTLYENALAICEKVFGPEHPDTASSLNNLARLLSAQGDLAGAGSLNERALAICENVLGPEHPDTAESLHNLALNLGTCPHMMAPPAPLDSARARLLMERALAIREKVLGPEHPDTAASLSGIAVLEGDRGRARPLIERALAICEKVLGPEHPDTTGILSTLASLLRMEDEFGGARPLMERALAIREKVFGPEHRYTASSLNDLANLLWQQGDLAGARRLYERALAIREKVLGPEDPDTATSLGNLANLLTDLGSMDEAESLFRRSIAIRDKVIGPEHPRTQRFRSHLADLLLKTGRPAEALTYAEAALSTHQAVLGPAHHWTNKSAQVTADALDALGRTGEAAELRIRFGIEPDDRVK